MRIDRLITLNVVRPLLRIRDAALSSAPRLPILMYHSVSDDPEPGVKPYYRLCTSPQRFAQHMQWLAHNGYRGVTLTDGLDWLKKPPTAAPPHRRTDLRTPISELQSPISQPVAITFDDGFRDFYTAAFPILQQHGFRGTMFLVTGFIKDRRQGTTDHGPHATDYRHTDALTHRRTDAPTCRRTVIDTKEFLTWPEVVELHRAGIEFGSHTVSHPVLYDLTPSELEFELRDCKAVIEDRLGAPARAFAYPYAFPQADEEYTRLLREALQAIGYGCCVTTKAGRARLEDDPFALPRLPVNSDDDGALFAAKLSGGYDWLAWPQAAVKSAKHALRSKPKAVGRAPVRLETSVG
ncbi:MAG TPA: polysaccharide deacetylase family protein [Verrucomicrobiota bacterium]|nr:polysaccharide deacetylase family protein [Verrucomicrobiota bacterium]